MIHNSPPEKVPNLATPNPEKRKFDIVWTNVATFSIVHLMALYGLYLVFTSAKITTIFWGVFLHQLGGFGISAGVHRLWSHRSYKAKWPLRLILAFCNTLAFQDPIINWARDHRVHHKCSDTDGDPYNAKRGFFFSHIGWLLCKKHPQVIENGRKIDVSDLWADPIVKYQKKYYYYLMLIISVFLPTVIPMHFWGETWKNAFFVNILRYTLNMHSTFSVNSAAHLWGTKPYDSTIKPAENAWVSAIAWGEGWHNYHHTFPWDYKTAELGNYSFNTSTHFINFFAKLGWAYELKTASPAMIQQRVLKSGDNTHHIWGWSDKNQCEEDYEEAIIKNKK